MRKQTKIIEVLNFSLLFAFLLVFSSCQPRGETKSLDEVLSSARDRFSSAYSQVRKKGLQNEVEKTLSSLNQSLTAIVSEQSQSQSGASLQQIEGALSALMSHAGYTSRPALNEVLLQVRNLQQSELSRDPAVSKLLSARIYSILSAELESLGFGL